MRTLALLALVLLALALAACRSDPETPTPDPDAGATAAVGATATVEATATAEESSSRSDDYQRIFGQSPLLIPPPTPALTPTSIPVATPTPIPTFTPTPGPTPTPTPRLTPTPSPTPTPTSREKQAFDRLSQLVPWFADPPDEWHAEAVTALVKTWVKDRHLGDAVALVPWGNDGIRVDEIRMLWYARDRVYADPHARVVQGRYWLTANPNQIDLREAHLEVLVLIAGAADDNPALVPVLQDLPRIAGSVLGDGRMAQNWVHIADRSMEAALTAATFAERNVDAGRQILTSLAILARNRGTVDQFDRLVTQAWFVDGLDDAEAASVMALYEAARQDPQRFDDLLEAGVPPTS